MNKIPTYNFHSIGRQEKLVDLFIWSEPDLYQIDIPHCHEYHEIMIFLKGAGSHEMDFKTFETHDNSFHIIPQNFIHKLNRDAKSSGFTIALSEVFVEQLCHRIIANSLDKDKKGLKAARASVFRTDAVTTQTTLIQFRVRNVIKEVSKKHEMVSEEMFLWGYEWAESGINALDIDTCKTLLKSAIALDISKERQQVIFEKEIKHFEELNPDFLQVVENRSNELVNAHSRFAKYLGAKRFEAVTPVLPPDILGVYVLVPNPKF